MTGSSTAAPRPDLRDDRLAAASGWYVVVYDNDRNTWDEVIAILRRATGCSVEEAQMETWEVHHLGRSIVHHGDRSECDRTAAIIRTIGIHVSVDQL